MNDDQKYSPSDFSVISPDKSLSQQIIARDAVYAADVAPRAASQRTFFSRHDRLHDPLYVILVVVNALRTRVRWKHYQDALQRIVEGGGIPITVEAAFGKRDFAVTNPGNPYHVQVRCISELWLKEALINRGVARLSELHPDWPKVAWIDADVNFESDDVMDSTRHELEHYDVVQMWSRSLDMDSNGEPTGTMAYSYGACYVEGIPRPEIEVGKRSDYYYYQVEGKHGIYWHPGYAWACTREWWDRVGGLIDWAIIGNGDFYMAQGMCGLIADTYKSPSPSYALLMLEWQRRCMRALSDGNNGGLGYVKGFITHKWHGPKADRGYTDRWKMLVKVGFDPILHLKRDRQLMWTLDEDAPVALRDGLRAYARSRNEDAV